MKKKLSELHRGWISWVMEIKNKSISRLATDAGLSNTTLATAFKDGFNGYQTSTIDAVMSAYSVPSPEQWSMGMAEDDAKPWEGEPPDFDLKKLAKASKAADVWEVSSDELAPLGFRRGDAILVDLSIEPAPGDVVVAQHYDFTLGRSKTVLRIFNGLHLATAAVTGAPGEILTMDSSVGVKGVVTARLWRRQKG